MKITIVTVCLNAEKTIELTVKSVLEQTYQEIEYLIIDGESNDRTLDIIYEYIDDRRIRLYSEKDNGLYNAMNKALDLCTGEYIIYMNSGDVFCDDRVLEDMVPYLESDLIYGNAIIQTKNGEKLMKYSGNHKMMYHLLIGKMMCHQSLFTRADIMKQYKFDEQFKIRADYDFIIRAKKNKCSMKYINRTICIVESIEGISAQVGNFDLMRKESDKSLKENFVISYYVLKIPQGVVRYFKRIMEK